MNWRKNETGAKIFVEYLKAVNVVGNSRYVKPSTQSVVMDNSMSLDAIKKRQEVIDDYNSMFKDIPSYIK